MSRCWRLPPTFDLLFQSAAFDTLHGDKDMFFVNLEDGADVGVIERGGGLRLTEEARAVFRGVRGKKLQGNGAAQFRVFCRYTTLMPPSPSFSRMR